MSNPLISIIAPCFKVEKYLDRCLETLVNQTLQEIEIILVDDGSPDRVPEMCDAWALRDPRIKVVHKQNQGLGLARNSGMEIAHGEYLAFVDSDDFVDLDMYRKMYSAAKEKDADVVYCGVRKERADGTWNCISDFPETRVIEGGQIAWLYRNMMGSQPGVSKEKLHSMSAWHGIYRRSLVEDNSVTFMSERDIVSEDIVFQVDFLKGIKRAVSIPDSLYSYCLNEASITLSYYPEKYARTKVMRETLIEKMGGSKEDRNAADRMFIGYVRRYILLLANEGRYGQMKEIVYDEIWKDLAVSYPPSNLHGYQKYHYLLLARKRFWSLVAFSKFAFITKRLKGYKV